MALTSRSDCVFKLCPFAPFYIPQDLMKQGQDAFVINLHFKQYQAIKYLDIFQLHQVCMFFRPGDIFTSFRSARKVALNVG